MAAPPFLPYGRQTIEDDDIAAVAEALRADFLTTGPTVEAFEHAFAETVGARMRSPAPTAPRRCTLPCLALDLAAGRGGDRALDHLPRHRQCARYVGAEVVFADVDPDTGLMTPETLSRALSARRRPQARAPSCPCICAAMSPTCRRSRRWRPTPARSGRGRLPRAGPTMTYGNVARQRGGRCAPLGHWPPSRSIR